VFGITKIIAIAGKSVKLFMRHYTRLSLKLHSGPVVALSGLHQSLLQTRQRWSQGLRKFNFSLFIDSFPIVTTDPLK